MKSRELSADLCGEPVARQRLEQGYKTISKALTVARSDSDLNTCNLEEVWNNRDSSSYS